MTRCRSQWQQMPSEPVIRCARQSGHAGWHYNTRQQRQWETGNRPDVEEPMQHTGGARTEAET